MKYNSTRNRSVSVSAAQAIAQGISADGGLFVPESLPQYSYEDLCKLKEMTYQGRAQRILSDFLTDFTQPEIEESVREAYSPNKSGENIRRLLRCSKTEIKICMCWSCGTAPPAPLRIWRFRFCPTC